MNPANLIGAEKALTETKPKASPQADPLRLKIKSLEETIQKAEMSGASLRDPKSYAKMRQDLSVLYGQADPNYQVKINSQKSFKPGADYNPAGFKTLDEAMLWVDRKLGNRTSYAQARPTIKQKVAEAMGAVKKQGMEYTAADLKGFAEGTFLDAIGKGKQGDQARDKVVDKGIGAVVAQEKATPKYKRGDKLNTEDGLYGVWEQFVQSQDQVPGLRTMSSPFDAKGFIEASTAIGHEFKTPDYTPQITDALRKMGYSEPEMLGSLIGGIAHGTMDALNVPKNLLAGVSDFSELAYTAFTWLGSEPAKRKEIEDSVMGSNDNQRIAFFGNLLGNLVGAKMGADAGLAIKNKFRTPDGKLDYYPMRSESPVPADVPDVPGAKPQVSVEAPAYVSPTQKPGPRTFQSNKTGKIVVTKGPAGVPKTAPKNQPKVSTAKEPAVITDPQVVPEPAIATPAKTTKSQAKQSLSSTVEKMPPEDIQVHPEFQYRGKTKGGETIVDPESNVTSAYNGVDTYVTNQAKELLVWERVDGTRYVVNGHHRLDIAKRAKNFIEEGPIGDNQVPREVDVRVIKEIDGWTAEKARTQGVLENLRDQKGNAADAAQVLRDLGMTVDDLKAKGISLKGATSKYAEGLVNLDNRAFEMVAKGMVDEKAAAGLGSVKDLTPAQQYAAMRDIESIGNATFDEGVTIGKKVKERGAPVQSESGGLFGDDDAFASYNSTVAMEAKLQGEVRRQVTSKLKDLLDPVKVSDKLIEGESINVEARKNRAAEFGTSASNAKDRLEYLFDTDPEIKALVTEQSRRVMNGEINELEATQTIYDGIRDKASGRLFGDKAPVSGGQGSSTGTLQKGKSSKSGRAGSGGVGNSSNRQRGGTNLKTVGAVAAILGYGLYRLNEDDADAWLKEHGVPGGSSLAAPVAVIGSAVLSRKFLSGIKVGASNFDLFSITRSVKDLADSMEPGQFKNFIATVMTAHGDRVIRIARDFNALRESGKKHFGSEKFAETEKFQQENLTVRDTMELNRVEGREWHEGLSDEWRGFVEDVKNILDPILDKWEAAGGRVKVNNDGSQQGKLKPGDSIKLQDGRFGEYLGARDVGDGNFELDVKVNPIADNVRRSNLDGASDTYVIEPGEAFGRPVDRIGEAYVPRFYTDEFLGQLKQGDGAFQQALRDMISRETGFTGIELDAAVSDLTGIVDNLDLSGGNVTSWLANLAKERQWALSKFEYTDAQGNKVVVDPYESSYLDSVTRYIEKANLRTSIAENFGVADSALGDWLTSLRQDPATSGGMVSYAEKLIGRILGLGPFAEANPFSGAARAEGLYQTATKLTGGTTAVAQVGDLLFPLSETGGKNVFKSVFQMLVDAEYRDQMKFLASTHNGYMADMFGSADPSVGSSTLGTLKQGVKELATPGKRMDGGAKFINAVMTWQGFRAADSAMKSISIASILNDSKRLMTKMASGAKLSPAESRQATRYGLDQFAKEIRDTSVDAVMNSERFQSTITSKVRQGYQYSGAKEDLPLWMSHPGGSVAMRFKKPWYVASRYVAKSVLDEALKGNFVPLGRFIGYGVTIGAGSAYLKEVIRLKGLDDETRTLLSEGNYTEAAKRFFTLPFKDNLGDKAYKYAINEDRSMGLMGLMGQAAQSMYDAGSLGMYGETAPGLNNRSQSKMGFKSRSRLVGVFEPVSLVTLDRFFGLLQKASGDTPEEQNMNAWADAYEAARAEAIPFRRVSDMFEGLTPFEVRRRDAERALEKEKARFPKELPASLRDAMVDPRKKAKADTLNQVKDTIFPSKKD